MTDPLLWSTSDAARAMGVSRDTVVRLIHSGGLPACNVGTGDRERLRLRPEDVRAWVDEHTRLRTGPGAS